MEFNTFESIKIGLASPEQIREWSYGVVEKAETINYRTQKPEKGGLFCERIFGPAKDWECPCGRYKKIRDKGRVCEKCGVEITNSKVRRERMGHIELVAPVSHIWYFKGTPSRIGQMLEIPQKRLEEVLYFTKYIVIDPGNTELKKKDILSEREYDDMREKYQDDFVAEMGAEAIQKLLKEIDLDELSAQLKEELEKTTTNQKRLRLLKRLEIVEAFRVSGNRPEWMVLDVIPVIPPEIRPMVMLDGGRYATSDLNDLYRRVITRSNRLKKTLELNAPEIMVRNEKRMLQEAVDALIDNGRHGRPVTGSNNRALKSLSDMLKGKQGRFRQNLLGKRVDYSGRSVIVVGPELKMYQCGLPKEMALELFKPFVMKRLEDTGKVNNIKSARKSVERASDEVWDALEHVIQGHPVFLNRAPTLHRLGIQAFEPVLVEGRAIKLHPLVCTAFNADFDGDQMAVHLPLSAEAQAEARFLMLAANNLLKPSDGRPVAVPTQDMVLGSYYLTLMKPLDHQLDKERMAAKKAGKKEIEELESKLKSNADNMSDSEKAKIKDRVKEIKAEIAARDDGFSGEDPYVKAVDENGNSTIKIFRDVNEALMAYDAKIVTLQEPIRVRISKKAGDKQISKLIYATVGRLIFNEVIPQNLGYVDRTISEREHDLEVSFLVKKKQLSSIIERCIRIHGTTTTSEVLDKIKALGYKFSTRAAITVAVCDATIPPEKKGIIDVAEKKIAEITEQHAYGYISDEEKSKLFIKTWDAATNDVKAMLTPNLGEYNPIFMMADSGARGSIDQIKQLAGMRGLISNTSGKTIELPIKANYREGLNILEYFISSRGARKGLADTALRTADSGYLTRRLVDVSQEVIIREDDCGTDEGIMVYEIKNGNEMIEKLSERLTGRYLVHDLRDKNGELIMSHTKLMNEIDAEKVVSYLESIGETHIEIRSVLNCRAKRGVCAKCYGANLANGNLVAVGEAVGIIAAQSIGEPGTQLTMRTFHTGGIASAEDITQGLPRVEELFESRKPKNAAIIAKESGTIRMEEIKKTRNVVITSEDGTEEFYPVPYGYKIKVKEGDTVEAGASLTEGAINPVDILSVNGQQAVQNYIITEVQKTYRQQGVDINDRHIEVIVSQMLRKVKIEDGGSSSLIDNTLVDRREVYEENAKIQARMDAGEEGLRFITWTPVLQGITKAASNSDSFLSAASFQETTRALTDAAIRGKKDKLQGLKENVIIGKLIPAGTGMDVYNNVQVEKNESFLEHNSTANANPLT